MRRFLRVLDRKKKSVWREAVRSMGSKACAHEKNPISKWGYRARQTSGGKFGDFRGRARVASAKWIFSIQNPQEATHLLPPKIGKQVQN